jgi:hypothetical protein
MSQHPGRATTRPTSSGFPKRTAPAQSSPTGVDSIENGEAADAWKRRAQRRNTASLSGSRPHSHGTTTPFGCERT